MTILELNQATVYRGDALVFDGLSLVLEEKQQTVILGPNGAGKSTILKLIAGELHPVPKETPSLRVFGEDRWNVWDLRKRLGVVSHDLQHRYMDHVRGLDVVLSGFYARERLINSRFHEAICFSVDQDGPSAGNPLVRERLSRIPPPSGGPRPVRTPVR